MRALRCPTCQGQRLNPQARAVTRRRQDAGRSRRHADSATWPHWLDADHGGTGDNRWMPIATRHRREVLKEIRGRRRLPAQRRPPLPDARPHAPRRCPAAKPSASAWPGRSAAAWSACSTFSTSRASACIRATTIGCCDSLEQLRDMGNTVVVVEHDEDTMRAADYIVDFGPGPGVRGGEVVAAGTLSPTCSATPPASPGNISPAPSRSPSRASAGRRQERRSDHSRRPPQQSQEHRRRDSARPVRLRHRRQRLGQDRRWSTTFCWTGLQIADRRLTIEDGEADEDRE